MVSDGRVLRLAMVGGGRRISLLFIELCEYLQSQGLVEVVGIANRTREKVVPLAQRLGCEAYGSIDSLLDAREVDAAIVSVSPSVKDKMAVKLALAGVHLFLDSPAAAGQAALQKIWRSAQANQCVVEIAEDQSYSPEAQLQRTLIESGLFGKAQVVINRGQELDYHAVPRLRNLNVIGDGPFSAVARRHRFSGKMQVIMQEARFGDVLYTSSDARPKTSSFRFYRDFQVVCERGLIAADYLHHEDWGRLDYRHSPSEDDKSPRFPIRSLSVKTPEGTFCWEAGAIPDNWSRQHVGLWALMSGWLDAIDGRGTMKYGLERAIMDQEVLTAWKVSTRTQTPVSSRLVTAFRAFL